MTTVGFLSPSDRFRPEASPVGGRERHQLYLARGLVRASRGAVRVDIIAFGSHEAVIGLEEGITLRLLPAPAEPDAPPVLRQLSPGLAAAVRAVDVLHVHDYLSTAGEAGIALAELGRVPVCATDHGGGTSRVGSSLGLDRFVDRFVCQSTFARSLLRASDTVRTVKGGVDTMYYSPAAEIDVRTGFLFVGRLVPHKGVDRLIEALPPDLPLTVCGSVGHAGYVDRLVRLAAGKLVQFVFDPGDDVVRDLYRRSWATVVPSVWRDCYGTSHGTPEMMGLTALESMACGTPAIVSDVAALPEFVEHGVTGFVFETVEELTACLRRCVDDARLSDRMGRTARDRVVAEWSADRAGARLLDVYMEVGLAMPASASVGGTGS